MGQIFEAGGPFGVTGGPFGPPVNMLAEALDCLSEFGVVVGYQVSQDDPQGDTRVFAKGLFQLFLVEAGFATSTRLSVAVVLLSAVVLKSSQSLPSGIYLFDTETHTITTFAHSICYFGPRSPLLVLRV